MRHSRSVPRRGRRNLLVPPPPRQGNNRATATMLHAWLCVKTPFLNFSISPLHTAWYNTDRVVRWVHRSTSGKGTAESWDLTVLVALAKRLAFLACGSQTEREKCKKSQTIIRRENERIVKEKEKEKKRHKYRRVNFTTNYSQCFL